MPVEPFIGDTKAYASDCGHDQYQPRGRHEKNVLLLLLLLLLLLVAVQWWRGWRGLCW